MNNSDKTLRIALIVGEASGDLLGAALIEELKKKCPNLSFEGILGPRLKALGGQALYDSERLAVMGFVEPLKRLPELLAIRRSVIAHFIKNPPDVFIGIDAPDFNLSIEKKLKRHGIKTIHYVSPSVWAWRQGRIKTIKKAVDAIFVLFPFEKAFYSQYHIPVAYVGHPMARHIKNNDFSSISLKKEATYVALLPGSRHSEINAMAAVFLEVALKLKKSMPHIHFLSPMASPSIKENFLRIKSSVAPDLDIELFDGQADEVLSISSCALITSGTATLQAMLHECPMVVAFKTSSFNAWLISKLYKHRFFALPNILSNKKVVPEYFQEAMTVDNLFNALSLLLENPEKRQSMRLDFSVMNAELSHPPKDSAAKALWLLLQNKFN